jgi:hypothetical protein
MNTALNTSDRLEIKELFARYCHHVDHAEADAWVALFTPDGVFDIEGVMRLQGAAQLRGMPGVVTEQGKGKWRHQITNIMITPTGAGAEVRAYGLLTDWTGAGRLAGFTEYQGSVQRVDAAWRIASLTARLVGAPPG